MGEMRNAYKNLIGKPEGNRPLEKTRRRREANIRMEKWVVRMWTESIWFRIRTSEGPL
jgi:hypothetical protein